MTYGTFFAFDIHIYGSSVFSSSRLIPQTSISRSKPYYNSKPSPKQDNTSTTQSQHHIKIPTYSMFDIYDDYDDFDDYRIVGVCMPNATPRVVHHIHEHHHYTTPVSDTRRSSRRPSLAAPVSPTNEDLEIEQLRQQLQLMAPPSGISSVRSERSRSSSITPEPFGAIIRPRSRASSVHDGSSPSQAVPETYPGSTANQLQITRRGSQYAGSVTSHKFATWLQFRSIDKKPQSGTDQVQTRRLYCLSRVRRPHRRLPIPLLYFHASFVL